MQGAGAVNFSMGGAATALPVDILGSLYWNPASISQFDRNAAALSMGGFSAAPQLYSSIPNELLWEISGTTKGRRSIIPVPAAGVVFGLPDKPVTFGISALSSGSFGVDYPETSDFSDLQNINPLLVAQAAGGLGAIHSEYNIMQFGFTTAYEITEGLSIGLAPTFNYAGLIMQPTTVAPPHPTYGYFKAERATAFGMGFQAGAFFKTEIGLNFGFSYKSRQWFQDFELKGQYTDMTEAPAAKFKMDHPAIFSAGIAYASDFFDVAIDYRNISYENAPGFKAGNWAYDKDGYPTGAFAGLGWKNVNVIAAGVQIKLVKRLPIRLGYTYSSNPITAYNAFFSVAAPAVVENAVQAGLSYKIGRNMDLSLAYHRGLTNSLSGQLMNPQFVSAANPLGIIPQTEVKSAMFTDLLLLGLSYDF